MEIRTIKKTFGINVFHLLPVITYMGKNAKGNLYIGWLMFEFVFSINNHRS